MASPRGTRRRLLSAAAAAGGSLWVGAPPAHAAPCFELRWPALMLDGTRMQIAPIRSERRAFDGEIAPFNC
jgi:hypothetical protein